MEKVSLIIVILMSNFLAADIFAPLVVVLGILVFIVSKFALHGSFLKNIWPLLSVFIIGILGRSDVEVRDFQRDLIYALVPIVLFYLGYMLAKKDVVFANVLKVLIFFGVILCLLHLIQFGLKPSLLLKSGDEIRGEVYNPGGGLILLSLILGLFQNRLNVRDLFPKFFPRTISLVLLSISLFLSFSRTNLLVVFLIFISLVGLIDRMRLISFLRISFLLLTLVLVVYNLPDDGDHSFKSKLLKSASEIAISDYEDMSDINDKWRGYETYRAFIAFDSGGLLKKVSGYGFGSLIDLDLTILIGEVEYSKIPILHNGYAYILVKMGLLGVVLYFSFYFIIIRKAFKNIRCGCREKVITSRLMLGLTLGLMFSMLVVGGMAQIHDSEFVLFVGYLSKRIDLL